MYISTDRPNHQFSSKTVMSTIAKPLEITKSRLRKIARYLEDKPVLVRVVRTRIECLSALAFGDSDCAGGRETRQSTTAVLEKLRKPLRGRARLRNKETASWLEAWITPVICGGRRTVDAVSSVTKILEAACDGKFVATFDYSLAFDFTNPAMAVELIRWVGMSEGTAGMLKSVAQSQLPALQYGGKIPQNCGTRDDVIVARGPMIDDCGGNSSVDPCVCRAKQCPTRRSCCTWTTDRGRGGGGEGLRNRRRTVNFGIK